MIFGFNTDVQGRDVTYHVQTEDRGVRNPVIESIIYVGGKILGKKRTPYDPVTSSKEQVEDAVRHQHKELTEAIRNGTWEPPRGSADLKQPTVPADRGYGSGTDGAGYLVELKNPSLFHQGEYFRFNLAVRSVPDNSPAGDVTVHVRWLIDGRVADQQTLHSRQDGAVEIWVSSPEIAQSSELIVRAEGPFGEKTVKYAISQVG